MNRILQFTKQTWFLPAIILLVALAASAAIVVARSAGGGPIAQAGSFTYECQKNQPTSMGCEQQHYARLTKAKSTAVAFADLKKAYNDDPTIKAYCHQLTHAIGRASAEQSKGVEDAYAKGDNFCWSGYYHGVMEVMVKQVGTKNIEAKITTICSALATKRQYSFDHYNCVHGLGHGVMAINANELFDALQKCDRFQDAWEASSCHSGVFMENVMAGMNPGNSTKYLKADQPLYPCTAVGDRYKEQCYLMQTSQALKVLSYDYAKVFDLCGTVGSYAATCYQSLGRDASGNSNSDIEQTRATCSLGTTTEARSNCVTGAVKDFISYYHSDKQATQLCQALE
ncbi:MAG TPA: hypothetical protein VMR98_01220, partial [Candidatus Polarisedimenticolaceae bacterium]|nr:hypothetical protein [Candidatus Polarisedimenticolaceae bacterium]